MGDEEGGMYQVEYLDGEEETCTFVTRAGKARVTYVNGDVYEGHFNVKKKKHGQGTYLYKSQMNEDEVDEEGNPLRKSAAAA